MGNIEGIPFENGATCKGVNYISADGDIDLARIRIEGRYPEDENTWARNKISQGLAHIVIGTGTLLFKDKAVHLLASQTVEIPSDTPYAWQGYFDMVTTWDPPFDSAQYKLEKDE